ATELTPASPCQPSDQATPATRPSWTYPKLPPQPADLVSRPRVRCVNSNRPRPHLSYTQGIFQRFSHTKINRKSYKPWNLPEMEISLLSLCHFRKCPEKEVFLLNLI